MRKFLFLILLVGGILFSSCELNLPEDIGRVRIEDSYGYGKIAKIWIKTEDDSSWRMAWHSESSSASTFVYFNTEPGDYRMKLSYEYYNAIPISIYSGFDYSIPVVGGEYTHLIFDGFYLFED